MKKKTNGLIYWAPRVLAILFLVFLALFSLDVFGENYGFWGTIVGLLIHNIPVFVLAIVLWISWKHEIVGGVVFILAALVYEMLVWGNSKAYSLIIFGPALVIGVLFLINWFKKKQKRR